ncbi:MAG TPA: glutaminyl-peptide cyclotransferase [Vicinamibacterales bacterium]|nr:glutaminyl-peptide cyclotransferase [Vicinamibacterales bacterium]
MQGATAVYGYEVVHAYPHDPEAFTQGLIYLDGFLYESTGLNGKSSVRKVKLETGEVLQRRDVDARYFAEGMTEWQGTLVQLTWQTRIGFVYDLATFAPKTTFGYLGEGWGLTHDATRLIMSDGTANLRFLDPATLTETGRVTVTDRTQPVTRLNELEFIKGEVYANVWGTDSIVRIAPETGQVTGWINLAGILPVADRTPGADVLNGIAYDAARDRLFVTGKQWSKLFEVRLVRRGS